MVINCEKNFDIKKLTSFKIGGRINEVFLPEKTAKLGVSAFWVYITPQGIKPYGHQDHAISFEDYCDVTNSKGKPATEQGRGCTAWVLLNENMDYLHCPEKLGWDKAMRCK